MATRQGKHKEGKTLLGAYVTPEFKALVIMTCDATNLSMTDLLMDGIRRRAMSVGIIDEKGNIKPSRREAYELVLETVKLAAQAKRRNRRSK